MEAAAEIDPGLERRRWKRVAILGGVLLAGPVLGILGTFAGMWMSYRRIESTAAPTPGELAEGVWVSIAATSAGLVLGVAGIVLLTLGLVRMSRVATRR